MKLMRQNYLLIDLGNTYVKVYDKNEQLIYREFTTNVEAIDTKLMTLNADAIIYSKVLNPFCQKIIENFKIPSHDIRNIVLEKKALLPTFKNFNLNELGTDIILGIMGAISKGYEDFIIVDDGTACTLSVVKTSEFLGVNIYPG
jgi:pantothenate kinase type III